MNFDRGPARPCLQERRGHKGLAFTEIDVRVRLHGVAMATASGTDGRTPALTKRALAPLEKQMVQAKRIQVGRLV
jgi:hypothetical protein